MTVRSAQSLLPHPAPVSGDLRLVLYAVRRMAEGGIGDAHAANAFLTAFGLHYRRPLVLVRALVSEMSRVAARRVLLAPCCCPRMGAGERLLVEALGNAERAAQEAHRQFATLLGVRQCGGVLASAQAISACFEDLGRPFPA